MATFEAQVEGLTSIAIGNTNTYPTQAQLSQFLKDGVIDVTSKHLSIRPQDTHMFIKESSEQTANGLDINGAKIVSVVREAGVDNDWRDCREIPVSLQSNVTDTNSLHYASKYNPAYMVNENGTISVFPSPGANPNAFKVYYVNNLPVDKGGDSLVYTHSDIKYFSDDKVYLVVLYASIKSIEAKLASLTLDEEDVELSSSLQITLQQLQNSYNQGFIPDRNYEALLQSQMNQQQQQQGERR